MFWIILGIGLMVAAFILAFVISTFDLVGLSGIPVIFAILGTIFLIVELQEKETAIEALQGNNPYEMKILYEEGDTIAYDTVYIKK